MEVVEEQLTEKQILKTQFNQMQKQASEPSADDLLDIQMKAETNRIKRTGDYMVHDKFNLDINPADHPKNDDDKGVIVEFYFDPKDNQEHIIFNFPGDKLFKPDYVVNEGYIKRFSEEYRAFKMGEKASKGKMLAELEWITRSQLGILANYNIHTLDQLLSISDGFLLNMPGGRKIKEQALEQQKKNNAEKLEKIDETNDEIISLKAQLKMKDDELEKIRSVNISVLERLDKLEMKETASKRTPAKRAVSRK